MKANRYVIIPAVVLYDHELSDRQKLLVGVVNNLSNYKGYCFASNDYLCRALNCQTRSLQRDLDFLIDKKYLLRQIERNEKNEVVRRILHVVSDLTGGDVTDDATPPVMDDAYKNKEYNNKIDLLYTRAYEEAWNSYEKRGVKLTAARAFQKLSKKDQQELMEHLPVYVQNHHDADRIKYLPHLSTYLNERRWESPLPYTKDSRDARKWDEIKWQ